MISIGTIKIKNLSTVSDRIAVKLVADYWLGTLKEEHMKFWKISIKKKLAYIISRYGDENGERLADWYLEQLISEELRAERVSKIFISVFEDRAEKRMRGISA